MSIWIALLFCFSIIIIILYIICVYYIIIIVIIIIIIIIIINNISNFSQVACWASKQVESHHREMSWIYFFLLLDKAYSLQFVTLLH